MPSPRSATSRGPNSTSASSGAILTRDTQRTGNTAEGGREDRFGTSTEKTGTVSLPLLRSLFGAWIPPRDLSNPFDLLPSSVDADVRIPPSFPLFAKKPWCAAGRGGWGHLKNREEMEAQRQREVEDTYRSDHDASGAGREVPTGAGMPDEVSVSRVLSAGHRLGSEQAKAETPYRVRYSTGRLLNHYAFSRIRVSEKKETTETSERTPRSLPLNSILIPLSHVVIIRGFSHTRRSASAPECAR
jgi:hypothetical protein